MKRRGAFRHGGRRPRPGGDRTVAPVSIRFKPAIAWQRLLRAIERSSGPVTVPGLIRRLGMKTLDEPALREQMDFLERQQILFAQRRGRYQVHGRMRAVVGRLVVPKGSFGFVVSKDGATPDVFIPPAQMKGAKHGDEVLARLVANKGEGEAGVGEGSIVAVLDRATGAIVGRFDAARGLVMPRDERIARAILTGREGTTPDGAIVWVDITRPEDRFGPAEGKIVEVAGMPEDPGVAEATIIRMLAIPESFPEGLLKEAAAWGSQVSPGDWSGREDRTRECIFTIDPDDARDHDDAVGIEQVDGPHGPALRLSVHIADVSRYVLPGSPLDQEATQRGTSVYLPGRCLPMLPEALSSTLCSLVPDENRLAHSVILDFAPDGKRISVRFADSVIRSRARLSYRAASEILKGGESADPALGESLHVMGKLAETLRRRRIRRGSLDLSTPDVVLSLDGDGRPLKAAPADRGVSEGIIEEFMLAANEAVADFLWARGVTSVWRIHEEPDPRRIADLEKTLRLLGVTMPLPNAAPVTRLKALLASAHGTAEAEAIGVMSLRALKLARYSHEQGEHFGLASEHYVHFTSPIRRYADLETHRLLRRERRAAGAPAGEASPGSRDGTSEDDRLSAVAGDCSRLSRRAEEAERAVRAWKIAILMKDRPLAVWPGRVTGLIGPGLLVTLSGSGVEGLIPVREGQSPGRYRLGEEIKVKVSSVDPLRGRVFFRPMPKG